MKISTRNNGLFARRPRRDDKGFIVIALMAILAIMLIYINVNLRVLSNLKREVKLVEQAQIHRLEKFGAQPLPLPGAATGSAPSAIVRPAVP